MELVYKVRYKLVFVFSVLIEVALLKVVDVLTRHLDVARITLLLLEVQTTLDVVASTLNINVAQIISHRLQDHSIKVVRVIHINLVVVLMELLKLLARIQKVFLLKRIIIF